MSEPKVERGILEVFRRGLKGAVSDIDDADWSDVDSIKKHKLLLMGIRNYPELDDQITIQWYLDGDMLPNFEDHSGPIQTNAGVSDGPIPDLDEVENFYTEEMGESLEEIIRADTFKWLKSYYEDRDIPFKDIYLANMDIHLHITQCARYCDTDHPNGPLPDDLISPIEEASTEMKQELIQYPLFRNLPPFVTEFEDLATQTMEWFAEQDIRSREDRGEYFKLFKHLDSFYYNGVWRPISNRIAFYTVEGPTDDDERDDHINDLKRARRNFLQHSTQFRNRANALGLRIQVRTERIPKLQPEEHNFEELLEWSPEDGSGETVTAE